MDIYSRIKEALTYIDPNLPRNEWIEIGMALKSEISDGFTLFDDWSKGGQSYSHKDVLATWQSIKCNGGITIRTLFYRAQQNGFKVGPGLHRDLKYQFATQKHQEKQDIINIEQQIEDTARRARKIWAEAVPASNDHSYLIRKKVDPIGIGEVNSNCAYLPQHIKSPGRFLVIPMHDINGTVWCVQFISEAGKKAFVHGKQKVGIFFRIGDDSESFAIVESAITGLSYHHATGETVYCAFSAGALKKASKALRSIYPYAKIKLIADDDWTKSFNVGVLKAFEAASKINAKVYVPDFEGYVRRPEHTDFNDLCVFRREYGRN